MATIPGLFHAITGITAQEREAKNVREFVADGTPELRVPGLISLESVRIGTTSIPLERDYKLPSNGNFTEKVNITLPQVAHDVTPDGVPILLRSKHSNDGIWQKGAKVYVAGEWESEAQPTVATDADGKAKTEAAAKTA
jgi:hypothetical protein